MKVFVIGGVDALRTPISSWQTFVKELDSQSIASSWKLSDRPRTIQFKTPLGQECAKKAFLVINPAGELRQFSSLTPIPTEDSNDDTYKIALARDFLVRYHQMHMEDLSECGYLGFIVFKTADVQKDWITAKQIIFSYVTGERKIDASRIDGSILCAMNSLSSASSQTDYAVLKKINNTVFQKKGKEYVSHFLEKLCTYTPDNLIYVVKKYFLGLFDPSKSLVFSCVPSTKSNDYCSFFAEQGYDVSVETVHGTTDIEKDDSDRSERDGWCDACSSCAFGPGSNNYDSDWES